MKPSVPRVTSCRLIIAFAVIVLLACCRKSEHNIQLAPGAVIKFELPYKLNTSNLRIAEKGTGFSFYSFTTKTNKRIDMFGQQGKLLKTIPLTGLLEEEAGFDDIAFNNGHFLLLSEKSNHLYTLDTNGAIINIRYFDAPYQSSLRREIRASNCNGFILSDNKYLFNCYYYFADTVFPQSYYDHNNNYPYFMEVDVSDSSHPAVSYRLPGFYTRFMPRYGMGIEGAAYSINEHNTLLSSWYTDSIYVIDKKEMQIIKVIPVVSDYTKVRVEPFVANDTVHLADDELNTRLQTQGSIKNVIYDPYRKYYYITLLHSTTSEQRKKNSPWSFIVLDSAFTRLGEVKMDENKYGAGILLVLEDGLLLKNQNRTPNEFQLYKISVR